MSKIFDLAEIQIQVNKAINPALSVHIGKGGLIGNEYRVNEVMKIIKRVLKEGVQPENPCPGYCDVCKRHCQLVSQNKGLKKIKR